MESAALYDKLREICPQISQNLNPNMIHQPLTAHSLETLLRKNLKGMPQLPITQIHKICQKQQKNVMDKILEIKQMDLYDQMANICPNKDLKMIRTYSQEEVNEKIQHYHSQIALMTEEQEKYMEEQEDHELCDDSYVNSPQRGMIDTCKKNNHNMPMDIDIEKCNFELRMDYSMSKQGHQYVGYEMQEEVLHAYDDRKHMRNIFEEYENNDHNVLNWPLFDHLDCMH